MRRVAGAVIAAVTATTLASCGTSSYCQAVEDNRAALDGFTLSTEAFRDGAEAMRAIAKEAPSEVRDDYEATADAAESVVTAQDESGVPMDQLDRAAIVAMDQPKVDALRAAYAEFANTVTQRRAIAEDVADACDVSLKTPSQQAQPTEPER